MRHVYWLRPLTLLALFACSDGRLEPEDETASANVQLVQPFDPLSCTLGDECERWGELIVEPVAQAEECAPIEGQAQPPEWQVLSTGVPCPLGRCAALDVQLALEPAGSLLVLSSVEQPSPMMLGREAGLWLARYATDGTQLGARLWDFAIPPPGVEVQRRPLLRGDAAGAPLLATARRVLPGDGPQPLSLASIGGREEPKPRPSNVTLPVPNAHWLELAPSGALLVGSIQPTDEGTRAVLTLLDRHGRVLWNRPWSADYVSTFPQALHIDAAGRITVQLATESGNVIARLDAEGRVLWQRSMADSLGVSAVSQVDDEGNVFVLESRFWDDYVVELQRIDALGRSTAAWSLAQLGFFHELHRGRDGVWLTVRGGELQAELALLPFGAGSGAACEGTRHVWPDTLDSYFDSSLVLAESEAAEVYVATRGMILKLDGGAP